MKNGFKKGLSGILTVALLSTPLSAMAAGINVTWTSDSSATVDFDGVNRFAVAQYNANGAMVNFDLSEENATSLNSIRLSNDPYLTTKVVPFTDWSTLASNDTAYRIGTRTYADCDMENSTPFQIYRSGHYVEAESGVGKDGTKGLRLRNQGTGDGSHVTVSGAFSPSSDFMMYELDLKLNTPASYFVVNIHGVRNDSTTGGSQGLITVRPNEEAGATSTTVMINDVSPVTMNVNEWYRLSASANFKDRVVTTTLYRADGTVAGTNTASINAQMGYGETQGKPCGMRIQTSSLSWQPSFVGHDIVVDNIQIYEGTQPSSTLNDILPIIDTSGSTSIYASDDVQRTALDGAYTLHTRNGVTYNGATGKKSRITPPDSYGRISVSELESAWGIDIALDGMKTLDEIVTAMGKTPYSVPSQYNSGLYVLADGDFTAPTNAEDKQKLNDFAFYYRPTTDEIEEAYNASPTKGEHPRIMATADDFARIKTQYASGENSTVSNWAQAVIGHADLYKELEPNVGWWDDYFGYRVTENYITTATEHMPLAATSMSMAYQLTEDETYLEELMEIMEYVAAYPDWAPTHHLSPPRIALGFIIAYDWCYDAWTPEEREFIEETLYEKFFYEIALAYQSGGSPLNNAAIATNNHNIVFNAVAAMGGLALMDVYPEESAYITSNAIYGTDIMWYHWAPNGAWYEGVDYWNLTMEYTVYFLSSLQSALNTMYGYDYIEGISDASEYMIYSQTNNAAFNYGDCTADHFTQDLYTPEMMWLSNRFEKPGITQAVVSFNADALKTATDNALGLLWYNTDTPTGDIALPLDKFYAENDEISMRNNWSQNSTSSAVGIHGGATVTEHSQLDGGSFIFEQGGVRWAIDTGKDNYNVPNYWQTTYSKNTSNRWLYFRSQPAAHNTIEINPSADYTSHQLDSYVDVNLVESGADGAIATADMSGVLGRFTTSATRGYFFTDNRESLVIRDELTINPNADTSQYVAKYDGDLNTNTPWTGMTITDGIIDNATNVFDISTGSGYFANATWGGATSQNVATLEFDVISTNDWNRFCIWPTAGSDRYGVGIQTNGGALSIGIQDGYTQPTSYSTSIVKNTWYKVSLVYDYTNDTTKLYVDGVLKETINGVPAYYTSAPLDFSKNCTISGGGIYIDNVEYYAGMPKSTLTSSGTPATADVYWYMMTGQDNDGANSNPISVVVAQDGQSAILTDSATNKQMKLEYVVTGGTATLTTENAETVRQRLITEGKVYDTSALASSYQARSSVNQNRIQLKVVGSGDVTITVKLTPVGLSGATPISDYTSGIASWTLQ